MLKKKRIRELKRVKDAQEQSLKAEHDDYMTGLYNGLEMAVAILEDREPIFETYVKEPEIKKAEEQKGRTLQSGIRRR